MLHIHTESLWSLNFLSKEYIAQMIGILLHYSMRVVAMF